MRVVIDTNTAVSALIWGGTPEKVITVLVEGEGVLLSSEALLDELENTLNKPKLQKYIAASGKTPAEILLAFRKLVEITNPAEIPADAVRDPDDRIVLAAAVGGRATHIVSGDKDLLVLGTYTDIPILSARDFLDQVKPNKNEL